jgi:hypothetical protein
LSQEVRVSEKLTIYVTDVDGKIIETTVVKSPQNKIEEIATKMGILKRARTMTSSGLWASARRFGGISTAPLLWIGAWDMQAGIMLWRSGSATVEYAGAGTSAKLKFNNRIAPWSATGASAIRISAFYGAYDNVTAAITNAITAYPTSFAKGYLWVEIEYTFSV